MYYPYCTYGTHLRDQGGDNGFSELFETYTAKGSSPGRLEYVQFKALLKVQKVKADGDLDTELEDADEDELGSFNFEQAYPPS